MLSSLHDGAKSPSVLGLLTVLFLYSLPHLLTTRPQLVSVLCLEIRGYAFPVSSISQSEAPTSHGLYLSGFLHIRRKEFRQLVKVLGRQTSLDL